MVKQIRNLNGGIPFPLSTLQFLKYAKRKSPITCEVSSARVFPEVCQTPKFHQQIYFASKAHMNILMSAHMLLVLEVAASTQSLRVVFKAFQLPPPPFNPLDRIYLYFLSINGSFLILALLTLLRRFNPYQVDSLHYSTDNSFVGVSAGPH